MHVDTRLFRGDRVRTLPDPEWPGDEPGPVWELLCDAVPLDSVPNFDPQYYGQDLWQLHIRHVTAGTYDGSAVGDTGFFSVRMDKVEFVSRAANPDTSCPGECS
jgi:hypothetical protein